MPYCPECHSEVRGAHCVECGLLVSKPAGSVTPHRSAAATHATSAREAAVVDANRAQPGYVVPVSYTPAPSIGATDNGRFTGNAEAILRSTGERIAWQGKPSRWHLAPRVTGWAFVLLWALLWAISVRGGWGWVVFWVLCAALHVGAGLLRWHNTVYRVTSQRLEITRGLLSQDTDTVNLVEISQMRIQRPFPWNLLGLANLVVDAADMSAASADDSRSPKLRLQAIRDVVTVRDLIHSSSNIAGQVWDDHRFGSARGM